MGHTVLPRLMGISGLKKQRVDNQNRTAVALTMAREIMEQRLWLPIYDDGGYDGLITAGEIAPVAPVSENIDEIDYGRELKT